MKTITFLRHNHLQPPFDNYDLLSLQQLTDLALGHISPDIQDFDEQAYDKLKRNDFSKIEIILHASSSRATKTAQSILEFLNKDLPIESTPLLNEIFFDPQKLVTPQELQEKGLDAIRPKFYPALVDNQFVESFAEVKDRAEKFKDFLLSLNQQNILCISHGFYLNVLKTYFEAGLSPQTLSQLPKNARIDYLSGFTINL